MKKRINRKASIVSTLALAAGFFVSQPSIYAQQYQPLQGQVYTYQNGIQSGFNYPSAGHITQSGAVMLHPSTTYELQSAPFPIMGVQPALPLPSSANLPMATQGYSTFPAGEEIKIGEMVMGQQGMVYDQSYPQYQPILGVPVQGTILQPSYPSYPTTEYPIAEQPVTEYPAGNIYYGTLNVPGEVIISEGPVVSSPSDIVYGNEASSANSAATKEIRESLERAEAEINDLQKTIAKLKTDLGKTRQRMYAAEQDASASAKNSAAYAKEVEAVKTKLAAELVKAQLKVDERTKSLQETQIKAASAQLKADEMQVKIAQLKKDASNKNTQQMKSAEARQSLLESKLAEARKLADQQEQRVVKSQRAYQDLEQKYQKLSSSRNDKARKEHAKEMKRLQAERNSIQKALELAKKNADDQVAITKQMKKAIEDSKTKLSAERTKIITLERSHAKAIASLNRDIQKAKEAKPVRKSKTNKNLVRELKLAQQEMEIKDKAIDKMKMKIDRQAKENHDLAQRIRNSGGDKEAQHDSDAQRRVDQLHQDAKKKKRGDWKNNGDKKKGKATGDRPGKKRRGRINAADQIEKIERSRDRQLKQAENAFDARVKKVLKIMGEDGFGKDHPRVKSELRRTKAEFEKQTKLLKKRIKERIERIRKEAKQRANS